MIGQIILLVATFSAGPEEKALKESMTAEQFLFGEEVVVSAAKHEEPVSRSPSAVTVITSDELKRYGSLVEALRTVPGVDVQVDAPSETVISIRKNGEGGYGVLFLIDGRKMTLDLLGGSLIEIFPLSLDDIERIEVIRGPGSALYGAALEGVINIITKDPKKTQGLYARFTAGQYDTREAAARASGAAASIPLRYRVTASADTTDSREASYVSKRSIRAVSRARYDLPDSSCANVEAGIDRTEANWGSGNTYTILQPYVFLWWEKKWAGQEIHVQANYTYMEATISIPTFETLKALFSQLNVGGAFTALDFLHIPAFQNTYDVEAYYSPFTDLLHNRLTIGTQGRYTNNRTPIEAHHILEESTAAVYLQDEYSPIKTLTVLLGGRYDYNSVSRPALSPRVSIVYSPGDGHTFRASYGESFRKPDFLESQFKIVGLSDTIITIPFVGRFSFPISNTGLKNQRNVTYEAGYRLGYPRAKAFLDAFFTNTFDEFIFITETSNGVQTYQLKNDPHIYYTFGGEAGAEATVVPDRIKVAASYSLTKGNDIGGLTASINSVRQRHKFGLTGSVIPLSGLTLGVQAYYIDQRTVQYSVASPLGIPGPVRTITLPFYYLINGSISYAFPSPVVEIGLSAFNILDVNAYDYTRQYSSTTGWFGGERLSRTVLGFIRASF